jgi:hypothetical protein
MGNFIFANSYSRFDVMVLVAGVFLANDDNFTMAALVLLVGAVLSGIAHGRLL